VFSKENEVNEKHVAKQNVEEPCAVMSARTDLWESWESNLPRPPGDYRYFRTPAMQCQMEFCKSSGFDIVPLVISKTIAERPLMLVNAPS
jgi:hypothetical protein